MICYAGSGRLLHVTPLDNPEFLYYPAPMPREARIVIPGVPHHITHRGNNKQQVFFDDEDRRRYLCFLCRYCHEDGLRILAYCLMPNHIHIVGVPARKESLSRALQRTQQEHTSHINYKYGRCGHLWHGRFYSCPMDLDHTVCALGYVELNPVRARMVEFPWDYPWSSAPAHCGNRPEDELLDLDRWFGHYTDAEWRESLLVEMENKGFLSVIRAHTVKGKPLGKREYFKERLE